MSNYDQRNQQVNQQYNVNLQSYPLQNSQTLLNQAVQFLEIKSYEQSIDLLNESIKADPSLSNHYYYLALALLKGRRPKILKRSEVERIDQLLSTAIAMGDADSTVQLFRILLQDDYYRGNQMKCPFPVSFDVISSIRVSSININRLKNLFMHLSMPDNYLYDALTEFLEV